jgi:hypothetical protein
MSVEYVVDLLCLFLSPFAILASVSVVFFIYCAFSSIKSVVLRLIMALHIALLLEAIVSIPFLFTENQGLCQIVGFVSVYVAFSQLLIVGMIVLTYRYLIFEDTNGVMAFMRKGNRLTLLICVIPVITVLPFISAQYGNRGTLWCSMVRVDYTKQDVLWNVCCFYMWLVLILVASSAVWVITTVNVFQVDSEIGFKFLWHVGMFN